MKKILLLLTLLVSASSFAADVTGKVLLDNTATYENCTVTFTPVSPSAVLAQTTSQSDGSFTANIANGVYNIKYEKNGYQTYELLNYFINDTVILNDVTLSSNNLVLVNGNVSGSWTKGNTYRITGNIIVPAGQTLTIEEGVEVKFDGYYSLIVNGTLLANGTTGKYIKFTSNSTSPTNKDWNQIVINGISKMDYCIIEYGKAKNDDNIGLINVTGNLTITNSIIKNSEQSAISIRNAGIVKVEKNKIYDCAYGFSVYTTGIVTIEDNEIFNHSIIGINIHVSSPQSVFKNNIVYNCVFDAIQVQGTYKIERNIVFNSGVGINVVYSMPNIVNNTIFSNKYGISIYDNPSIVTKPSINSNIIMDNSYYGIYSTGVHKPELVSYNLFYNNRLGNGNNNLPVGVGTIITINKNNTPADAYYNIFVSPEFESIILTENTFCTLKSNSPAVNAGDPSIAISNGTIVDIGAKELGGNLSTGEFTNAKLMGIKVFPNPTTDFLYFEANQNQTFDSIKFFDVNGKTVDQIKFTNSVSDYQWKVAPHLTKGVYLFAIMNGNTIIDSGKFIKK
ncbi:right-handed parallel beta-helix repeat-containing protein [Flavobacterium tistrianum]|uniref:right-handed parallel beta-helix repeat-containing protein n=1 Tax=Flavobacterium tistrianum TaxID=1685414 RepID=UPI000DAE2D8C|nr:right-handed parallel beta-helix repeat-containing protein [Flavobacterium tistrianum]KAF2342705.1 T9SS type A sorting domain-containing protein [Flavobacterium tistrianum]